MKLTALWSPEQQFQHKNGAILTNGKIYVYLAGRTELAQIFVDDDGIHQSQNPVILDDNGRAVVYADEAYSYTAVVCDYYGQEQFSFKPIGLGGPGSEAPKQIDIQSNSLNVEKSYNERTNTETFTLEVKNSDCKSWIGRDGQSSVIPADTEVEPLALPSTNEYDGDFIDRIENDNTIFLKEGLYHVDCVMEFTQESGSEENKFGQIEVFTGLGNGEESTNLEINETGPLCDDEVRHCIKQTFIRKVKAGSDLASSELYFRPLSPVPLSSCKIKSLSIVELSITGNTDGANYYAGEHVQITDNHIINVTGLQPSGNYQPAGDYAEASALNAYATVDSVTQGFYGVAQQINTLSGAIDDVASSIPSIEGLASETYVDEHIEEAVSGKADRSEIPSLEGYATEQYVQSQVSGKADKSEIPSLQGYATESWVQNQHYLTSVPDNYATDAEVQSAVSGKADKSEIPSLAGYATETYVQSAVSGKQDELEFTYDSDNKITSIDGHEIAGTGGGGSTYSAGQYIKIENDVISVTGLQESGNYLTPEDLNGYATTEDVEEATSGKLDSSAYVAPLNADWNSESGLSQILNKPEASQLIPGSGISIVQSGDNYIINSFGGGSSYQQGQYISIENETISVTGLQPSGQYLVPSDLNGYATTQDVEAATSGKADVSAIPSVAGLASETYVQEQVSGLASETYVDQHIEEATSGKADVSAIPSLQGYATETWVSQQGYLTEVPAGYATVEDVNAATSGKMDSSEASAFYPMASNPSGYLTEHQSLAGYATEQYVQDQTSGFVDSGYVSQYVESQVSGKQDELEFTYNEEDKISAINGSAIAGGSEVPIGVMTESGLKYNAVGEISGYGDSAIAQYGAEKQWLVHDDTIVHQSNSAQYAFGVNISATKELMGLNQPNQWIDVKSEVSYNSNAIAAGGFNIIYNPFLKMVNLTCDVQVKAGSVSTNFMTWSERLKPATDVQFALGNGLYVSSGELLQGAGATMRWINDCWCWGVKGE